jgi:hypothetical protein
LIQLKDNFKFVQIYETPTRWTAVALLVHVADAGTVLPS